MSVANENEGNFTKRKMRDKFWMILSTHLEAICVCSPQKTFLWDSRSGHVVSKTHKQWLKTEARPVKVLLESEICEILYGEENTPRLALNVVIPRYCEMNFLKEQQFLPLVLAAEKEMLGKRQENEEDSNPQKIPFQAAPEAVTSEEPF
jgi:hypothetical protein